MSSSYRMSSLLTPRVGSSTSASPNEARPSSMHESHSWDTNLQRVLDDKRREVDLLQTEIYRCVQQLKKVQEELKAIESKAHMSPLDSLHRAQLQSQEAELREELTRRVRASDAHNPNSTPLPRSVTDTPSVRREEASSASSLLAREAELKRKETQLEQQKVQWLREISTREETLAKLEDDVKRVGATHLAAAKDQYQRSIDQLKTQLHDATSSTSALQEELKQKSALLARTQADVGDLKQMLQEATDQSNRFSAIAHARDSEVEGLKAKLLALEKDRHSSFLSNQQLADRERTVVQTENALQEEAVKVWNELETRRRDALKRETLLEEQSQTVETDRAMLSAVEAKLSEREQTLLERERKLDNAIEGFSLRNSDLSAKNDQLAQRERRTTELEAALSQRESELHRRESELTEVSQRLKEAKLKLASIETSVSKQKDELETQRRVQQSDQQKAEGVLTRMNQLMKERDAELRVREDELARRESDAESRTAESMKKWKEAETEAQRLQQKEIQLKAREMLLVKNEAQWKTTETQLRERRNTLEAHEAAFASREKLLQSTLEQFANEASHRFAELQQTTEELQRAKDDMDRERVSMEAELPAELTSTALHTMRTREHQVSQREEQVKQQSETVHQHAEKVAALERELADMQRRIAQREEELKRERAFIEEARNQQASITPLIERKAHDIEAARQGLVAKEQEIARRAEEVNRRAAALREQAMLLEHKEKEQEALNAKQQQLMKALSTAQQSVLEERKVVSELRHENELMRSRLQSADSALKRREEALTRSTAAPTINATSSSSTALPPLVIPATPLQAYYPTNTFTANGSHSPHNPFTLSASNTPVSTPHSSRTPANNIFAEPTTPVPAADDEVATDTSSASLYQQIFVSLANSRTMAAQRLARVQHFAEGLREHLHRGGSAADASGLDPIFAQLQQLQSDLEQQQSEATPPSHSFARPEDILQQLQKQRQRMSQWEADFATAYEALKKYQDLGPLPAVPLTSSSSSASSSREKHIANGPHSTWPNELSPAPFSSPSASVSPPPALASSPANGSIPLVVTTPSKRTSNSNAFSYARKSPSKSPATASPQKADSSSQSPFRSPANGDYAQAERERSDIVAKLQQLDERRNVVPAHEQKELQSHIDSLQQQLDPVLARMDTL